MTHVDTRRAANNEGARHREALLGVTAGVVGTVLVSSLAHHIDTRSTEIYHPDKLSINQFGNYRLHGNETSISISDEFAQPGSPHQQDLKASIDHQLHGGEVASVRIPGDLIDKSIQVIPAENGMPAEYIPVAENQ